DAAAALGLGRSAGRRASALWATGRVAGFLALADLVAERLAGISRSSKACALRRTRDYTGRLLRVNGAETPSFLRVFPRAASPGVRAATQPGAARRPPSYRFHPER